MKRKKNRFHSLNVMISMRSSKVRSFEDEIAQFSKPWSEFRVRNKPEPDLNRKLVTPNPVINQKQSHFFPILQAAFRKYCDQTSLHGYSYLYRDEDSPVYIINLIIWIIVILVKLISPTSNVTQSSLKRFKAVIQTKIMQTLLSN